MLEKTASRCALVANESNRPERPFDQRPQLSLPFPSNILDHRAEFAASFVSVSIVGKWAR